jgi:exopolysaccharide production protein ExoZ
MQAERSVALDQLRGLAVVAVVIMHAIVLTPRAEQFPIVFKLSHPLGAGMQLFFVLSGLMVALSLTRSLNNGEGLFGYFLRRFSKIAPLYYLFIAINIFLFLTDRKFDFFHYQLVHDTHDDDIEIINISTNVLFLQGFNYKYLNTILDGDWSIVNEVYFYIIYAIFYKYINLKNIIFIFLASCIFASAFNIIFGYVLQDKTGFTYYGFPTQLPAFIVGVAISHAMLIPQFIEKYRPFALAGAAVSLALIAGHVRMETAPVPISVGRAIFWIPLALTALSYPAGLIHRGYAFLRIFGQQSYAVFLGHIFLLRISSKIMNDLFLDTHFVVLLVINLFIGLIGSLFVSSLIFNRIDRYFVRRASEFLAKRVSSKVERTRA